VAAALQQLAALHYREALVVRQEAALAAQVCQAVLMGIH
jgi:hypothetical protein